MKIEEAVSFRKPLAVKEILMFSNGDCFPLCPRCDTTLEREYQHYCDRCGQCLDWKEFYRAKIVRWMPKD